MDRFIQQANIDHYRKLMAQTADESIRQRIQQLLDEEYGKDLQMKEEEMARA